MEYERVAATPTLMAIVNNVKSFNDIDRMPCPYCNDQMFRVVNGDYPFDEYRGTTILHTEHYYCANCGTFAEIAQSFDAGVRKMKVARELPKEE